MNIEILDYLFVIILGLIIGSFLNVIILRFDDLKSAFFGRSKCPHCARQLIWYELIPVISFILLGAKCRNCKKAISVQYPLVEAGTALIFALLFWRFGSFSSIALYFYLAISAILIVIFVYDILHQQISDWLVIAAAALWLIFLVTDYRLLITNYLPSLYGALALGGFFGLMVLISREKWMGAGDIGLGALLGALVGWPNVLFSAFSAFFLGGLVGIILILLKKKKMQSPVPFAPFLILGTWLAILWGNQIVSWYASLIGIM